MRSCNPRHPAPHRTPLKEVFCTHKNSPERRELQKDPFSTSIPKSVSHFFIERSEFRLDGSLGCYSKFISDFVDHFKCDVQLSATTYKELHLNFTVSPRITAKANLIYCGLFLPSYEFALLSLEWFVNLKMTYFVLVRRKRCLPGTALAKLRMTVISCKCFKSFMVYCLRNSSIWI